MQAKKVAAQVAQLAKTSDNKRCFDCEQLVSISGWHGHAMTCVLSCAAYLKTVVHTQRIVCVYVAMLGADHMQGTTYYVPQFSIFVCTPCSGFQ